MNRYGRSEEEYYEYCPRCDANLSLQKGYSNDLPYWVCKGCGEMLINPEIDTESSIVWICDGCGEILNLQDGFNENCEEYVCKICGHVEHPESKGIFRTEAEYEAYIKDPCSGLSDEDILALSLYEEIEPLGGRNDIMLVKNSFDGKLYVRKFLETYDEDLFAYLLDHPISHMPKIKEAYKSRNALITIEEYISGENLMDLANHRPFPEKEAIEIGKKLCDILLELQRQDIPIIHRDVKPSNVIISSDGEVYLIDVNIAKFYDETELEDTRLLGTKMYAAPEQAGYGFGSSSGKTDVYGLGMLLNVIITLKAPKQELAAGFIGDIILKCIRVEPKRRPSVEGLKKMLEEIK